MFNNAVVILKEKVQRFADGTGAKFLGEQVVAVKRQPSVCNAAVEYDSFRIHITYRVGRARGPKSILSCMLFAKNDTLGMGYQIYDILNVIDENDFSPYTYPYLPDTDALSGACDELLQKLTDKLDKIKEVFDSPECVARLRDTRVSDINDYFGKDVFEVADSLEDDAKRSYLAHVYDVFFSHTMSRFVSQGYAFYLNGDKKSASRLLGSGRAQNEYEKRFFAHLKDSTPVQGTPHNYLSEGLTAQGSKAVMLPTLLVLLVVSAVLTPLFYGLHYLFIELFAKGAIYNTAAELENALFCTIPALVTGAGITVYLKKFIVNLTPKKVRVRLKKFSKILTPEKDGLLARYGLFTAAVVSVVLSMVIANTGVKFFDNTIKINASPTQLRAVEYTYSSIAEVTEQSGSYGAKITTVRFDDGAAFSFVSVGEQSSVDTKIYPILQSKGIEIIK